VKDSMKDSEEAIDKVLAGLRDVAAPAGMERRVLDRLEELAQARSRTGWSWLGSIRRVVRGRSVAMSYAACGVAVAVIFVLALAVPAIRRLGHAAPVHVSVRSKMVVPERSVPLATSEVSTTDVGSSSREPRVRLAEAANSPGARLVPATDSDDSVALSETRAASFPAPPMPLTEQERLLLRLAHRNDSVELAMLDPKLRELRDAQEKAEFQRFFGRSTPVQPNEQTGPGQPSGEQTGAGQSMTDRFAGEPATVEPTPEQSAPAMPK